ncbi:amidase signature domain-containing protein [Nemania abortiva]|nr:amidase signature domain-containing protein [Nemania abortiva]
MRYLLDSELMAVACALSCLFATITFVALGVPTLLNATIEEIAEGLDKAVFTSAQLVRAYQARVQETNDHFHAFIQLNPEAEAIASALDLERKEKGRRSILHGIPILLKDNIITLDGTETTSGSTVLLGSKSGSEATIVDRLRQAGVVILGKSNLSEFAGFRHNHARTGWSARGGQATGIFWPGQKPSGSSTGSAISVGLGLATAALGTETVSSIVSPAEKAGVVGFKPTRRETAFRGLIPVSVNLDIIGPIARTVKDIDLIMTTVEPSRALLTVSQPEHYPLRGIQVGVFYDPEQPVNMHKVTAFKCVLEILQSSRATLVDDVRLPALDEYLSLPSRLKTLVMEIDFKISMEAYFRSLTTNPDRLKNLHDLMESIKRDPRERYPERNIAVMEAASKTSTQDPDYLSMLKKEEYFGSTGGIEGALNDAKCKVLISPTSSLTLQRFAAMGGNPVISVPLGVYPEGTPIEHDEVDGLVTVAPGITFSLYLYARKFDDESLLLVAHVIDKSMQTLKLLKPYKTPQVDLKDQLAGKAPRQKM